MARGETYEEFVEKFKPKKTTDDCYTPPLVYEAVANWVSTRYGLSTDDFVRPFYPGGDYEHFDYGDKIVVDNPPFSIITQAIKFYNKNNIKYFLFSPTLAGPTRCSNFCTAVIVGVGIVYENGAIVNTSFVTNLEPSEVRMMTAPTLYKVVDNANKESIRINKKKMPKYIYPSNLVTTAQIAPYNKYDIEFVIKRNESVYVTALDIQRASKKSIYGCGLLISDKKRAEREKAEREKAELWTLSERELKIIAELN